MIKWFAVSSVIIFIGGCNVSDVRIPDIKLPPSVSKPQVPDSSSNKPFFVKQSLTLKSDVNQRVIIEDSNVVLDCAGHILHKGAYIRSKRVKERWMPPKNVTVRNCISRLDLRVYGMARNGEGRALKESSQRAGHTARVQAAAPSYIRFENIQAQINGPIGFYFAPGVTHSSISNSLINGDAVSTSIYLDAESAYNRIENNRFDTVTAKREQIAIDGSAHNRIINNHFTRLKNGGIFLYRNCGEGGNTRHQTPSHNIIVGNTFQHDKYWPNQPSVWLASRNGNRNYCHLDAGHPYGSSKSDLDHATHNLIENNTFINRQLIKVDAEPNIIRGNRVR